MQAAALCKHCGTRLRGVDLTPGSSMLVQALGPCSCVPEGFRTLHLLFPRPCALMSTSIFYATLQAVGLRGYAQRDPLVEYKLEGYNLFLDMMAQIRRNTIYNVYQFDPTKVTPFPPSPPPHPPPAWMVGCKALLAHCAIPVHVSPCFVLEPHHSMPPILHSALQHSLSLLSQTEHPFSMLSKQALSAGAKAPAAAVRPATAG